MGEALEPDVESISSHLEAKQRDFDVVMDASRRIIRGAGRAITLLHSGRQDEAKAGIDALRLEVGKLKGYDATFRYASIQAYQEYAEAVLFYGVKYNHNIQSVSDTGVDEEAYLLGLMDLVGELRREVLESLRAGKKDEAERYYEMMRRIYDTTRSLKFAEAVLAGFRRKQDVARMQLESAGSELLHAGR